MWLSPTCLARNLLSSPLLLSFLCAISCNGPARLNCRCSIFRRPRESLRLEGPFSRGRERRCARQPGQKPLSPPTVRSTTRGKSEFRFPPEFLRHLPATQAPTGAFSVLPSDRSSPWRTPKQNLFWRVPSYALRHLSINTKVNYYYYYDAVIISVYLSCWDLFSTLNFSAPNRSKMYFRYCFFITISQKRS